LGGKLYYIRFWTEWCKLFQRKRYISRMEKKS